MWHVVLKEWKRLCLFLFLLMFKEGVWGNHLKLFFFCLWVKCLPTPMDFSKKLESFFLEFFSSPGHPQQQTLLIGEKHTNKHDFNSGVYTHSQILVLRGHKDTFFSRCLMGGLQVLSWLIDTFPFVWERNNPVCYPADAPRHLTGRFFKHKTDDSGEKRICHKNLIKGY